MAEILPPTGTAGASNSPPGLAPRAWPTDWPGSTVDQELFGTRPAPVSAGYWPLVPASIGPLRRSARRLAASLHTPPCVLTLLLPQVNSTSVW